MLLKAMFLCAFLLAMPVNAQQKRHNYIESNQKMATELSKKYGIPSGIILAIAFVETGGGTSKGARTYNNHFGIIGKNKIVKSRYKSFASTKESYEAFCKLITSKKYYTELKGNNNLSEWVTAIASAGYSEAPLEWKRRVNLIIDKFNLS